MQQQWNTSLQNLGPTTRKHKQMKSEHGYSCAGHMEKRSQRQTTKGSSSCSRCARNTPGTHKDETSAPKSTAQQGHHAHQCAKFEDEINVQMGAVIGTAAQAAVNTVGAANKQQNRGIKVGASEVQTCTTCGKTGHNARDCLQFILREGTCPRTLVYALHWHIPN